LLALTPQGAEALGADKAYDSDRFVAAIKERDMEAVIPPRANRTERANAIGFLTPNAM